MQNNDHHPQFPTLADLIALLDQDTLRALTARLHRLAAGAEQPPEQMLMEFIDDCLTAHEEEIESYSRAGMANTILESLSKLTPCS